VQRVGSRGFANGFKLFSPGTDPGAIPPKRPYRRTRYFAARELSRRCVDTLREANPTPMTTGQIAVVIMLAKGYPADDDALKAVVIEMVVTVLRRLCKEGSAVKSGTSRDAQWMLAPSLL
jgi:hypothetical protein